MSLFRLKKKKKVEKETAYNVNSFLLKKKF